MNNMNCVSTMPEVMPEITDEAIIEALFAQRPYEEKVINSAFLEIPADYQRELNIPNVEKMSAEFTELIANPPKVSYRDGHYFVFDGQHTIVTRKTMNGGNDLPIICKVYTGLTKEEEAILFSKQTGVSRPLTAGAELRAALVGKDAESIAFLNATESTGLQLGLDRANHHRGGIVGVQGAGTGGGVFALREQPFQLCIFLCPTIFAGVKGICQTAPAHILGKHLLFLGSGTPVLLFQLD